MEYKKISIFVFLVFGLSNLVNSSMLDSLQSTLSGLCGELQTLIPVTVMFMVVLGSVIYAIGQVMGAETRARANVWATAMITGAIFGILIDVLLPNILQSLYGNTVSCGSSP